MDITTTEDFEITVGARIEGDLARWFEEYRWSHRKIISDVMRDALVEYKERHPIAIPDSAPAQQEQVTP